ncbi:MAG: flavin reductase family protein [Bacteroidota bacterium]
MSTITEAVSRKFPEGIVLVSSVSKEGRVNVMPAGWSMVTSNEPLLVAVSVGKERYTHALIMETREFVLAYPSFDMADDVMITGTQSGRDTAKMERCRLRLVPAEKVGARLIEGAVANLECRLHSYHPTGDHTIFVGEVVAGHVGGPPCSRLMNFGRRHFAVARMDPEAQVSYENA